jgi:hypothetical protein
MKSSFLPPDADDLGTGYGIISSYVVPPPFLSGSQHFRSSEDVEGQLPELTINAVYDHFGKPGSVRMVMEMADSEVLLNHIADYCFVLFHTGLMRHLWWLCA